MTGIFEDFTISMIQPSRYGEFLKKKKSTVALFVIILVTVAGLANVLFPLVTMGRMMNDFYTYDIPYFKVENGEFFVEEEFELKEAPIFFGLTNDKSYSKSDAEGYDMVILADKEQFIVKNNSGTYAYRMADLGENVTFDKNSVYMFEGLFKAILVFSGVFAFALSFLGFFIGVWLVRWLSRPFVRVMELDITPSEHFRLAIYSRTVPVLIGALLSLWSFGLPYIFSLIISEAYLYFVFINMKKNSTSVKTEEKTEEKEENNELKNIIKLSPQFKDYLWGGVKLREEFNKKCDYDKIAESWELSTHKDGSSVVSSGKYSGMSFSEYINLDREGLLGKNAAQFDFFPILIKFIDAKDSLSIQVHPDDDFALENEHEYGKTEMWYIMDCEEGAYLYYGFKYEITKEEYQKRIEENTLLEVLNKVYVKKGDVFFIKSGTVHAIGPGNLICEVQQNSNTTYRVYDYNRKDKNGNTRELHIEKALLTSKRTPPENYDIKPPVEKDGYSEQVLSSCKYFCVKKLDVKGNANIKITPDSFHSLIILEGEGMVKINGEVTEFKKGDSIFIPAGYEEIEAEGNFSSMLSYV